jgi:hypothetical protein
MKVLIAHSTALGFMFMSVIRLIDYITCDHLCMTFYGQILYPALLGNNWIYEMYYNNNKN